MINHRPGGVFRKPPEGADQVLHRFEVVEVVVVDVQNDCNIRREMQKGVHKFAGLNGHGVRGPGTSASADGVDFAAE